MMRKVLLAGLVTLGWATHAVASPITADYDFTSTFSNGPYGAVSGSFVIQYDPAIATQTVVVDSFSSPELGSYSPISATDSKSTISLGTAPFGGGFSVDNTKNDFGILFDVNAQGQVTKSDILVYTNSSGTTFDSASSNVVEDVAVPEPASYALLGLSVAGIVAMRRRRASGGALEAGA